MKNWECPCCGTEYDSEVASTFNMCPYCGNDIDREPVEQWEYKHAYVALFPPPSQDDPGNEILSDLLRVELDKYGADGWELVTISNQLISMDSVDGYAVFKRKIDR